MIQVGKNVVFRDQIGIPTILGEGAPSFRKHFSRNVLPLSQNASHGRSRLTGEGGGVTAIDADTFFVNSDNSNSNDGNSSSEQKPF